MKLNLDTTRISGELTPEDYELFKSLSVGNIMELLRGQNVILNGVQLCPYLVKEGECVFFEVNSLPDGEGKGQTYTCLWIEI